jgi:peptidyl-prolyl cis-trans isomerase C
VVLLVAVLALFPLTWAADTNTTKAPKNPFEMFDEVVAQGDNVKVTRAQLDEALVTIRSAAAARGQNIPPQAMRTLEAQVLSRLIGMQVLLPHATEADKATGVEIATKQVAQMKEGAGGQEAFTRQLKTVGMSEDTLTKRLTDEATADAILKRELKVEITDADVKKFYDENPNKFEKPETVHAAHILIGTTGPGGKALTEEQRKEKLALAEKLLKRAKDGENFGALAAEFSDDPGSKNKGGEYTFPRGQMVAEFETVAFSQKTNQISDIVTTQFGYHIIKTLEKTPAKTVSFDEAQDDIRKFLEFQARQVQTPAYMEKQNAAAHVEILVKELKEIIDEANAAAKQAAADKK